MAERLKQALFKLQNLKRSILSLGEQKQTYLKFEGPRAY